MSFAYDDNDLSGQPETMMSKVVRRKLPDDPTHVPPLLDRFSRTRAAPKRNGLHMESVSDSIGSYASPQASVLKLDPQTKEVVWKTEAFDEMNARGPAEPPKVKGKYDFASSQKKIDPESSLMAEIREAGISVNEFYETFIRFQLYCEKHVPLSEIPEIKEEWIHNIDFLVQHENIDLPQARLADLVNSMVKEVRNDYIRAAQRSVVEYVFSDPLQRARCGVLFVPDAKPLWGAIPFEAPEGTQGGAPLEWRPALDAQRRALLKNLTTFNEASVAAQTVWESRYSHLRLFEAPEANLPVMGVDQFTAMQAVARDRTRDELEANWSRAVRDVLIDLPFLDGQAPRELEIAFFKGFATLLATQIRGCVEGSIQDFVTFMERFANPVPPTAAEVREQPVTVPAQPSFLVATVTIKGADFKFKTALDSHIRGQIIKTFNQTVAALRDLPRPDMEPTRGAANVAGLMSGPAGGSASKADAVNGVQRTMSRNQASAAVEAADGSPHLRYISDADGLVARARQRIEDIIVLNQNNAMNALSLLDDFRWLLTHADNLQRHLENNSTQDSFTRAHLQEALGKLDESAALLRDTIPREVRLQMITVDMSEVIEGITQRITQCRTFLLRQMADRMRQECISIDHTFESEYAKLTRNIGDEAELVNIEQAFDDFRGDLRIRLTSRFHDQLQWLNLLFEAQATERGKLATLVADDFTALYNAGSRVRTADEKLKSIETYLQNEHVRIEDKFKVDQDDFIARLKMAYDEIIVIRSTKGQRDTGVGKGSYGGSKSSKDTLALCVNMESTLQSLIQERANINSKEMLLGLVAEPTPFELLDEARAILEPVHQLWELEVSSSVFVSNLNRTVANMDIEPITTEFSKMFKMSQKLELVFQEYHEARIIAGNCKQRLSNFKKLMAVWEALSEKGMRERHWEKVSQLALKTISPESLTLAQCKTWGLDSDENIVQLSEISEAAQREAAVEATHAKMEGEWEVLKLEFELKREVPVLSGGSADELQALLDDQIVRTQTIRGSPFARHVEGEIMAWDRWLNDVQRILEDLLKVQKQWIYLEPIFASEDIMKQLPAEGKLFREVNADFRSLMLEAHAQPTCRQVFNAPDMQKKLTAANNKLETVQVGLNQYLETKRRSFPRFFFLSNEELLSILSETREPRRVQKHVKKCFDGVAELEFQADDRITGMISEEGELVPFETAVDPTAAKGNVEQWLSEVEVAMLENTRRVIFEAFDAIHNDTRTNWVQRGTGQAILAVDQIMWTHGNATAIMQGGADGLKKYANTLLHELNAIVALVRSDIPKLVRCTLEALIVLDVHGKDVTEDLANKGVSSENDFDWLVQLRYYIEENHSKLGLIGADPNSSEPRSDLFVRISNSHLPYMYEYLGNSARLVITPLTDRCYRTLCGALHLAYGGAPEGPAGTGKTETVKDLGKALARMVQVTNCTDGLDVQAMEKMFSGLAATGGWACFDEFNRINVEVLSVIAEQITTIQAAVKAKKTSFEFGGTTLRILETCNCFITMNPGYAGRAELPDNLKALFRSVAMMVPDYRLIAEISLYSFGFDDARNMARKITTTYKLCSEQLSAQKHYDYGMRAVKAVLTAAGNLKRRFPTGDESQLILRAINDVNLAKFLEPDVPLFEGITADLFPSTVLDEPDYKDLLLAVRRHLKADGLQASDYALKKIIQLYEMILVRHGLMVVGDPWGGKSSALSVLARALSDLGKAGLQNEPGVVKMAVCNPKSVHKNYLYGENDEATGSFADGVLAALYKQFAYDPMKVRKWLVLDGPVDAVWIEDMNTVLDDNKKLCLKSGEVVAMPAYMNMIFEPMDLAVASPATVSRCGMVYFEPEIMGVQVLIDSWLDPPPEGSLPAALATPGGAAGVKRYPGCPASLPAELRAEFRGMVNWLLNPLLDWTFKHCKFVSPSQKPTCVSSFLKLMGGMLRDNLEKNPDLWQQMGDKTSLSIIDGLVVFCLIWSVGTIVNTDSRKDFDHFFKRLLGGNLAANTPFADVKPFKRVSPSFPERNSVWDYWWNVDGQTWISWQETVEGAQTFAKDAQPSELIVRTTDMIRYNFLGQFALRHDHPILFCGATGTGKTVYMESILNELDPSGFMVIPICFSAQTSQEQTQALVDGRLDRAGAKNTFGASMGRRTLLFVDDLNMPAVEDWGAQPPIELLRQFLDYGGWYDLPQKEHPFRRIVKSTLFSAMGLPGGGRSFVSPRILRHFHMVGFPLVESESLHQIFNTVLTHTFSAQNYPSEVAGLSTKIVNATMEVYKNALAELRPTPMKSHYLFNLRDFSNVVQGFLMVDKDGHDGSERVVRLWTHEVWRVFGDRLVDQKDRQWLLQQVRDTAKKNFSLSLDACAAHLDSNGDGKVDTLDELRFLLFGDLMSQPGLPKRPYVEIRDFHALQTAVDSYLEQYNQANHTKQMPLVMFNFAIEHLARVTRVLKVNGGNVLLVGVGGSGRQSVSKLASFMADCYTHQVEISKSFSVNDWRDSLKVLLKRAGGKGDGSVFLFTDSQIKYESFVEDINNLLNAGEVPNMWPSDEKAELCEMVRNAAKQEGKAPDGTPAQLYQYMVQRSRKKLHIVFCLSPIGDAFRKYVRQFPSLVNCCTIDWFDAWPADALVAVAERSLASVDLSPELRAACVDVCQFIHAQVGELADDFWTELKRRYYTTPTSFLELIHTFKTLLSQQREKVQGLKTRYEQGLLKLNQTKGAVAVMQDQLTKLKPQLEEQSEIVRVKLIEVAEKANRAAETRTAVDADREVCAAEASEAKRISDICEAALDEVRPIMKAAMDSLSVLSAKDFGELRTYASPPAKLLPVCEALCILLGTKIPMAKNPQTGQNEPQVWKSALSIFADTQLVAKLSEYHLKEGGIDATLTEKVWKKFIEVDVKPIPLDPPTITNSSKACGSVAQWVLAICQYERVYKEVRPKEIELENAQAALAKSQANLALKEAALAAVQKEVDDLNAELKSSQSEQKRLQEEYDLCVIKLKRANELIESLGSENDRWTQMFQYYSEAFVTLTGDMLVSAGIVAYLGAFTPKFRSAAVHRWLTRCQVLRIPGESAQKYSIVEALGDPVQIQGWFAKFLPKDTASVENAIIMQYVRRWPLCIDPQGQATNWIKKTYAAPAHAARLAICKPSDANMAKRLEQSIQLGQAYLLEAVGEELDPSLEPLLLKQTFKRGGALMIKLGDASIEYNGNFRFYMTTKLRNPHYLPEVAVKVTLLNFMITLDGLQDQLLGAVVRLERADLEEMKQQLIQDSADNKLKLQELESKILEVLNNSQSILDDENGIDTLKESKRVSKETEEKQKKGEETEKEIDASRQQYVPVAARASTLFFAVADLAAVDPMYQYSLPFYMGLFEAAVGRAAKSNDVAQRLVHLNDTFLLVLFQNICRSLFERHKLLFSFLLYLRIQLSENLIKEEELRFIMTGGVSLGDLPPKPAEWVPDRAWTDLCGLDKLSPAFAGVASQFAANLESWKAIFEAVDPFEVKGGFPSPCGSLSEFQLLLVVRCLRPDRLMAAVRETVLASLGEELCTPPPFDLEASFNDSQNVTPLIFVLSPGSDPLTAIAQFGQRMGQDVHPISLGQGQGPKAEHRIEQAQQSGEWVVLQNCHLADSWMPRLELKCEAMEPSRVHRDFRLWLTSYPSPKFPVGVLQAGVKMTNEPPKGLRANVANSFRTDPISDPAEFNQAFPNPAAGSANAQSGQSSAGAYKRLMFSLCFFHAVIQERRLFGPLGWNIPYEFNDSDLRISAKQLGLFLSDYPDELPFPALRYLTGECNYGGRVTDDKDRRLLMVILNSFYNSNVLKPNFDFATQSLLPAGADLSSSPYACPADSEDQTDYFEHVMKNFPVEAAPEVLGFHANARLTKAQNEAYSLLFDLLLTSADIQVSKPAANGLGQSALDASAGASAEEEEGSAEDQTEEEKNAELQRKYEALVKQEHDEAARVAKAKQEKLAKAAASDAATFQLCADILGQLPPEFDIEAVQAVFPVVREESMNTVLVQELERFNVLLRTIKASLRNIQKALQGLELLSASLEKTMRSLLDNRIPAAWEKYSYPSLKPLGAYIKDLLHRLAFFQSWVDGGRPPRVFWLSGFFFTQSFLTGVLQNFARACHHEIDRCDHDFVFTTEDPPREWDDEEALQNARKEAERRGILLPRGEGEGCTPITVPLSVADAQIGIQATLQRASPEEGVFIEGLFLEGARFDRANGCLAESNPRELFVPVPVIRLKPSVAADITETGKYNCPVYKVTSRRGVLSTTGHSTNFVMMLRIPSPDVPEAHWIKRGVALITQLDS